MGRISNNEPVDMDPELGRGSDLDQVRALPHRYASALNRRAIDELGSLMTVDAHLRRIGGPFDINITGRAGIVEHFTTALSVRVEMLIYLIGGVDVLSLEGAAAHLLTTFQGLSRSHDGSGLHYIGMFDDDLVRTSQGWQFSRRWAHPMYMDTTPPPGTAFPALALPSR